MNNPVAKLIINGKQLPYSGTQIASWQRKYYKLTNEEFAFWLEECVTRGIHPGRRLLIPVVFMTKEWDAGAGKKVSVRNLEFIETIESMRIRADATGNYAPHDSEPEVIVDETLKKPGSNPLGLVEARVKIKKFSHGEWHVVRGTARWDERAKLKDGKITSQWGAQPKHMLVKSAFSDAFRQAFPALFEHTYSEGDLSFNDDENTIELTPAEYAEVAEAERRREAAGIVAGAIGFIWDMEDNVIEMTSPDEVFGKAMDFIWTATDADAVKQFQERNKAGLRDYWSKKPEEALKLKQDIEKCLRKLETEASQ